MSKSPPTFGTDPALHSGVAWDDMVTLHRRDSGGVLHELKTLRTGTLADLVRHVMRLPAEQRRDYVIELPGDHNLDWAEIAKLSTLPEFPADLS